MIYLMNYWTQSLLKFKTSYDCLNSKSRQRVKYNLTTTICSKDFLGPAQDQPTSHACVVTTHYTASFKIIQHATDDSLYSLASKYPFRH